MNALSKHIALCEITCFDRVALPKSLHKINKAEMEIKDKQYEALWPVVKNKNDTICVLPTGYGKSLIYQLLPFMFDFYPRCENNDLSLSSSFVLVISP
jgi:superfamily II DNA helicase RecQ